MVAVNLNTETQAEIGKKGKASNAAGDLFTQLLNNALEKQKQPTVLDPKQAMQNAQKGDFGALTQEVLKSISKKSEPQNTQTQDSQKLNNANKAYSKAQGIKEQPQPAALREDSTALKEQAEPQKAAPQTASKEEKAETNAKDVAKKDTKESTETKEPKTAKAEKEDKQEKQAESKDTKPKQDDTKTQDLKQKLASKDAKSEAKDSKEKNAAKEESKGEAAQNSAKEKLAETKQEMQKTNDDLLTSMLRNSKQMLKDSEKNKERDAKESGKAKEAKNAKESEKADTIKESKNAKESAKPETKDVKVATDSKEKIDVKQSTEDSKTLRETKEKAIQTTTAKVVTQTTEANAKIELATLLNFRTSTQTQKGLKEDLQNTIADQKERLANTNPQDSLHIANRLAKIIDKLLVRYQSDDPNAIAGAFKHGMQLASLSAEESKALAQINAELLQKGISLREILLQALEELQTDKQPKNVQAQTKESLPTTDANAQKIMTQLVQDIKDNLRDTILGFIGKENKEMPQTILGMSKGVSNTEFATDIKDIVQKLETILRETLKLEESETKAIGKEILIQNLLKDSNTTKIAFDKKDLILMRAQSLVQSPQNQHAQSKEAVQNEVLNKILNGSTMSLSLLKELAGSFVNYQEQEQWLQKFAEFTNLNLKDFQYSGFNSTSIFSELGAKNALLSALLQGNMELQKTLFDYAKEAQGGKAPNLAAPIPSRVVPNTTSAPIVPDVKHPLTAKLAELNAKSAAMVGAKPDFTPNDVGKISLEELITRERLAIQKAVEQTKVQTTMQQPNTAESSIAKTLQAFKEEIYKEVFSRKNEEPSEEETILNRQANKTTKTETKKTSTKASSVAQNRSQSSSVSEDRYRQNNANNERPNPTHNNQNTTSETLKWEQNEYDKKQASQQEAQRLHNQNTTLLTPENKKQAASAGAGKTILDVLGAKITQSAQAKEAMPQAVVLDSKADILYRSAAAKETLRNFTGSLREGINNYKPPLSKLSIELSPEHLGNVEVTLKQRGTQLIVQIHSNPQALQLFMANAQDFKQQLFGIGYENIEMTFQDADGNTFSEGGSQGGNGRQGGNNEQHQQNEHEHEETTLEELQMRQEMAQEIVGNGKTWNTFGLQAYKNSDSVMQKLRFLELTLTPKYA